MPLPYSPVAPGAGNPLPNSIIANMIANDSYLDNKINDNIQIGARAWMPTITNGATQGIFETTTNAITYATLEFPDTGGKVYATADLILPNDYDGGTITAIFFWTANSVSTNSVVWGIQGRVFVNSASLDQAYGTAQEVTQAYTGTAYQMRKSSATSAITFAGSPSSNQFLNLRIYRDSGNASDNLAATALLLAVVLQYTRS